MWGKAFWKGALERMVKTAAQALLALITVDQADLVNSVPLRAYTVAVIVAAAMSLLSSLVSAGAGPAGSASLVADRPADPQNR